MRGGPSRSWNHQPKYFESAYHIDGKTHTYSDRIGQSMFSRDHFVFRFVRWHELEKKHKMEKELKEKQREIRMQEVIKSRDEHNEKLERANALYTKGELEFFKIDQPF